MRPFLVSALRTVVTVLAILGAAVVVLRLVAPTRLDGGQVDQALAVAAIDLIPDQTLPTKTIYISVNGRDPLDELMDVIHISLPSYSVRKISERPTDTDSCGSSAQHVLLGSCKQDNFLELRLAATPLWRTAIVQATTAVCGIDLTLVRAGNWNSISRRGVCT